MSPADVDLAVKLYIAKLEVMTSAINSNPKASMSRFAKSLTNVKMTDDVREIARYISRMRGSN